MKQVVSLSRSLAMLALLPMIMAGCTREPEACFSPNRNAVIPGKFVTFINCSANSTAWNWDFGDGNTSTDPAPIHSYSAKGTYTVTMTALNDKGDENSLSTEIFVGDPGPLTVVVDTVRFPATAASDLEVYMDGLTTNSLRITPIDLPAVFNVDGGTIMNGTSYDLRIKTTLDDATVSFNPQTDIRGDMTLRVTNPPFWSAYILFTGR